MEYFTVRLYTLRLVGSISYLGGCYRRTKVTKCICQKMTLFSAVLISMCEPLNYIHQDTKSARLIAVCKRSITLNKFGKRARGCCVHVFLVIIFNPKMHCVHCAQDCINMDKTFGQVSKAYLQWLSVGIGISNIMV